MENQDVYNIYKLYKEGFYGPFNQERREWRGRHESSTDGEIEMYLSDTGGDYDSQYVRIEIENGEVVSVVDAETGEDLPLSAVTKRDYDLAISRIMERD
jgi:hypothetical protein